MYNYLADNAQSALENTRREQEERKKAMLRQQKTAELKKLETQLFYKKQEVERLQALANRLKRESALRKNIEVKEVHELQSQESQLKDAEKRIKELNFEISKSLADIGDKISKEKAALLEHQHKLEELEKQKRLIEGKKETQKRSITESISRILFFRKKETREAEHAKELVESNQKQLVQIEQSLKMFSQEVTVLENKIRTLSSSIR